MPAHPRVQALGRHLAPAPAAAAPRRTVYLASGLGFSAQQRALVLPELVRALEAVGAEVFEPFVDNEEGAKTQDEQPPGWAYRIGQADIQAVRDCDVSALPGCPPPPPHTHHPGRPCWLR